MNRTRIICNLLVRIVAAGAITGLCVSFAMGATLEAYKARVDAAVEDASELESYLQDEESDTAYTTAFVENIRRSFPASERVEWSGGTAEVSNEWLLMQAKSIDDESDPKKQLPHVVAIREDLASVSYKLSELERTIDEGRTKDEDKQKLSEILRREEYQKVQKAQESAFQKWLREFLEWLASLWPTPNVPGQSLSGMEWVVSLMRLLLYAGLALLAGFLIYKLAPVLIPSLKRAPKPKKTSRVILGEHIGENESSSDLFREADRLAREGNLRGAIRKGYVALLCDLSDRKVIGLARHKTNRDYVRDVRSRRDRHPRMKTATEIFEQHWYGSQESVEHDWIRFREEYDQVIRSV